MASAVHPAKLDEGVPESPPPPPPQPSLLLRTEYLKHGLLYFLQGYRQHPTGNSMEIWLLWKTTSLVYRLYRSPRSACQSSAEEMRAEDPACTWKEDGNLIRGPQFSMDWYFKTVHWGSFVAAWLYMFNVRSVPDRAEPHLTALTNGLTLFQDCHGNTRLTKHTGSVTDFMFNKIVISLSLTNKNLTFLYNGLVYKN